MTEPVVLTLCAYCKASYGTCSCPIKCKVKLLKDQISCSKCDRTDSQIAFGDPMHECRLAYSCLDCLVYTCEDCHTDLCAHCDNRETLKIFYTSHIPFDHKETILPHCHRLFKASLNGFNTYHKTMTLVNEYVHWIKSRAGSPDLSDAPSKKVNRLWLCHIIDTVSYSKFCQEACGVFVHHDPTQSISRHSGIEVGIMLAGRREVSCLAMKLWGMKYRPICPYITVKVSLDGKVYEVKTQLDTMICDFDKQVREVVGVTVNVMFNGSVAHPARTLEYYRVEDGSSIKVEKFECAGMLGLLSALSS